MYDNLDFKLRKSDGMNVDFLGETPCYLSKDFTPSNNLFSIS